MSDKNTCYCRLTSINQRGRMVNGIFYKKSVVDQSHTFLKMLRELFIQIEFGCVNSEEFNQLINTHMCHKPIKFMLRSNVLLQNRPN